MFLRSRVLAFPASFRRGGGFGAEVVDVFFLVLQAFSLVVELLLAVFANEHLRLIKITKAVISLTQMFVKNCMNSTAH